MKKRILSILLCLCMVLMLCPVAAFAETPSQPYTVTRNFKYGTLLFAVGGATYQTSPYTEEVKGGNPLNIGAVIDCAPYKFVGWKETGSGKDYAAFTYVTVTSNLTFEAVYEVDGSLAITVDGFEVGNTPADCTYSFESTIPGVTFSADDIQNVFWEEFVFDGSDYTPNRISNTDVFEADTRYRVVICLDNKGLDTAPAVTVNGKTPEDCLIATRNGVPIQLQIFCTLGTPPEPSQYTVTYDGGEGSDPVTDVKTHGEPLTLRGETFKMDGFVQTGWVDKETGAVYRLGDTYTENADVTLNPVFEKIITLTVPYTTTVALGDVGVPGEKTFTLALIGDSAPDKDKSNVTITGSVTTNGKGSYNGTLTFTGTERTLWVMLSEGAFVQQVNAGEDGWTYDDTVWGVLMEEIPVAYAMGDDAIASGYTAYVVPASIDGNGYYYIDWENLQAADMAFTNTYTAHDYALKHDATHHWDECACKDVQNKELHKYGDWTVTKEATEQEAGEKEHTCTVCGYTEKAEIEKLPATTEPTKPGTDTKPGKDNPATGDNSHMALWIALLFMSGAGVIGTTVYGKKKRAK